MSSTATEQILATARLAVDEDDRHTRVAQARERREVVGRRGHQHAVDPLLLEEIEVGRLAVQALVAAAEQHRHALLRGARLGAPRDLGEERVADVEHDEADAAAAPGAQLPGGVVADVTELGDRAA